MMFNTSGKVVEINKRGFRIKSADGHETQISAGRSRKLVRIGDEVRVSGGMGQNGVFLEAWTDICRAGQWLEVEDLVKQRSFRLKIAILCVIALLLLIAGMLILKLYFFAGRS